MTLFGNIGFIDIIKLRISKSDPSRFRLGLKSNDWGPYKGKVRGIWHKFRGEGHETTEAESRVMPHSQGMPQAPESRGVNENLWRDWTPGISHFRLPASVTMREYTSVVWNHQVYGNLLQQPQETNTHRHSHLEQVVKKVGSGAWHCEFPSQLLHLMDGNLKLLSSCLHASVSPGIKQKSVTALLSRVSGKFKWDNRYHLEHCLAHSRPSMNTSNFEH